jgi:hypothetical protein
MEDQFNTIRLNAVGNFLAQQNSKNMIRIVDMISNGTVDIIREIQLPEHTYLQFFDDLIIENNTDKRIVYRLSGNQFTEYVHLNPRIDILGVYNNILYYSTGYYRIFSRMNLANLAEISYGYDTQFLWTRNRSILKLENPTGIGYLDMRTNKTVWFDKNTLLKSYPNSFIDYPDYGIIDVVAITDEEFIFATWDEICSYSFSNKTMSVLADKGEFRDYYSGLEENKNLTNYYAILKMDGNSYLFSIKERSFIYKVTLEWVTGIWDPVNSFAFCEVNNMLFMYPIFLRPGER